MLRIGKLAALLALALAVAIAVPATAGKKLEKLDSDSEKSKDVGFGLSGSATPLKKFVLKVKSKPRGVKVSNGGLISCNRGGSVGKSDNISATRKAPYKLNIKPTINRNKSCSMSVSLNTDRFNKPVKVSAKLFKKK